MHAKLLEKHDLGGGVRHFLFEIPELDCLHFVPGQFLSLSDEVNGRKVTRAYSLASPPDANRFELCLNRVNPGTFSPHLFSLEPGGEIPVTGPLGTFRLREPVSDSVFVATGTGVAPLRSMLLSPTLWRAGCRGTLVLGVRFPDGVLYREDFEALARSEPGFRFWPVVSRPTKDWAGRTGHVQDYLVKAVGDRGDIDIYICGLTEMVNDVRARLKTMGFDKPRILFEKYG